MTARRNACFLRSRSDKRKASTEAPGAGAVARRARPKSQSLRRKQKEGAHEQHYSQKRQEERQLEQCNTTDHDPQSQVNYIAPGRSAPPLAQDAAAPPFPAAAVCFKKISASLVLAVRPALPQVRQFGP